ncbi:MAG: hypothetical protein AAF789_11640 [Bacteroidota bacterium]
MIKKLFYLSILVLIIVSCSNAVSSCEVLQAENEELLELTKKLTETAEKQRTIAEEAAARAVKQAELAEENAARATAAQAEAQRQADMALYANQELQRALDDCNGN